ncbi:MAG: hypothetical protein ACRDVD_06860 [Acidimicrobiia bacterium]
MADRTTRRIGCGCLPLVVLFFVGSLALRAFEEVTDSEIDGGVIVGFGIAVFVLLAIVGAARQRRRSEASDTASDGIPTATGRSDPVPLPAPPPVVTYAPPPSRGRTDPVEEPETQVLRRRLGEAVADIAKEVEGTRGSDAPPLTSEEMIARAKRRIEDWRD